MRTSKLFVTILLAAAVACKGGDKAPAASGAAEHSKASGSGDSWGPPPVEPMVDQERSNEAMSLEEGKLGKKDGDRADGQFQMHGNAAGEDEAPAADAPAQKGQGNQPEGLTRAWFPETFLFAPLVVTDDNGAATVPVRVPDRLTTWRVLALAHSRTGAQGGAVTSFLGTLPTYVDPIVPPTLVVGDDVRIPIQLVNTTDAAVTSALGISAENATVTGPQGVRTIPAGGSKLEYARLRVDHAGTVSVRVTLGDTDAVVRTIEVVPSGRPVVTTRSGTLAAPRTLTIPGEPGADPTTGRIRVRAYPGALALLRSELGVSTDRSGVADDAYALLLAGRATELLAALGDSANPEAIRDLSILTAQRAIRDARTLDVDTASLLAEAALAHPDNPVLQRLGERALDYLARAQRPDGTFAGGNGETVQRVLVATADATRAVRSATTATTATVADQQRATGVAVRAAGAFERNAIHVEDGYTAAAILASGAVTGSLADELRTRVLGSIKAADDGAKFLEVGDGVVRADGTVPSTIEATAFAVLALAGDPKAPLADLGATLLGGYDLVHGWGDGRTNLVAMRAVIELFKDPVPDNVRITLTMDGTPVVEGILDRAHIREVLALDAAVPAPGLAGAHEWKLVADPPVPGLGYSLQLESWVPWQKQATQGGVELALPETVAAVVGQPTTIAVTAIAPSGMDLHIQQALPTGVQVDTPSLQALVDAGTITRFVAADGTVDLYIAALDPGAMFSAKYRVVPTLAGTLHTTASMIEAGATTFHVPPSTWTVR